MKYFLLISTSVAILTAAAQAASLNNTHFTHTTEPKSVASFKIAASYFLPNYDGATYKFEKDQAPCLSYHTDCQASNSCASNAHLYAVDDGCGGICNVCMTCADVSCNANVEKCVNGQCVPLTCADNPSLCSDKQKCVNDTCIAKTCADVSCGTNQKCDAAALSCINKTCPEDFSCSGGTICKAGTCVNDTCPGNKVSSCDTEYNISSACETIASGKKCCTCIPKTCLNTPNFCPEGQTCDTTTAKCTAANCVQKGYTILEEDCYNQCRGIGDSCEDPDGTYYTNECSAYECSHNEICLDGYCSNCNDIDIDYYTPERGYSCHVEYLQGLKCCYEPSDPQPLDYISIYFSESYLGTNYCQEQYLTINSLVGEIKAMPYKNNKIKVYDGETVKLVCIPQDSEYVIDWESLNDGCKTTTNSQGSEQILEISSKNFDWNSQCLYTPNLDSKSCVELGYLDSIPAGQNCKRNSFYCYTDCVPEGICKKYNTNYADYHQTIANCKKYKYITNAQTEWYSCLECSEYKSEESSRYNFHIEVSASYSNQRLTVYLNSVVNDSSASDSVPSDLTVTLGYYFDNHTPTKAAIILPKGKSSVSQTFVGQFTSSATITSCSLSPVSDSYADYSISCEVGEVY